MRRLYMKIYLSFVVIIAAVAVLAPLAWWMFGPQNEDARLYDSLGKLVMRALPPAEAPPPLQRRALRLLADDLNIFLSLYSPGGRHIASSNRPLPLTDRHKRGWHFERKSGPLITLYLPDHRILVATHKQRPHTRFGPGILLLAIVVFSLGVYLLVRRLTGRLEQLRHGVEQFGRGDLTARVAVEGRDEIADLAERFNQAAGRIEQLVASQKNMLATASHELRTPLTRMRLALDLFVNDPKPELKDELERNITELDRLIDEVLMAGKLDAATSLQMTERIDLLGMLAEEAAHYDAEVSGDVVVVDGDEKLLRRLIRNLLENARRYGNDEPVDGSVARQGEYAIVRICDRGIGVPETERERIFEPFYRPAHVAEGKYGGVGLGLSLVRQIAERHGGAATCLPRDDGGSCFEIRLPVKPSV